MEPNNNDNPFLAPAARVSDFTSNKDEGALLPEPMRLEAGRGISWIKKGWELYCEEPGLWAGIILAMGIISIVMSLIPLVNILSSLISMVFIGGLMLGCHDQDQGESLKFGHLFAGFHNHFGKLVLAGLFYLLCIFAVVAVVAIMLMFSGSLSLVTSGKLSAEAPLTMLFLILVVIALLMPAAMAMWFAPPLIVLHDLEVIEAFKLSFKGCLRNMLPFLLFGVILSLLAIVATIPLALGWLVLAPVVVASQYTAYREIFVG